MLWKAFTDQQKDRDLQEIISRNGLNRIETENLIKNSFKDGVLKTTGTEFDGILPPLSRFGGVRQKRKRQVISELNKFFEQYSDIR